MNNERFFLETTEFFGYKVEVDLNNVGNTDFKSLWAKLDEVADKFDLEKDMFFIGYEDYRGMTKLNKKFYYYAMLPGKYFESKPDDMESLILEQGEYIKFESNFHIHGPSVFQKAYKYLSSNKIKYDNRFDFELIPRDAHPGAAEDDENSKLYIALKLK